MPDETPSASPNSIPATEVPAGPVRKPRSPVERVIVWGAITGLLIVAGLQWRAHDGFSKTRNAIQAAIQAVEESPGVEQRSVSVNDVPAMIHGSPRYVTERIDIPFHPEKKVDTYTWRGVLKPYTLRLYYGVEGKQGFGDDRKIIPADLVRYEIN